MRAAIASDPRAVARRSVRRLTPFMTVERGMARVYACPARFFVASGFSRTSPAKRGDGVPKDRVIDEPAKRLTGTRLALLH
jgi:hypothetical protein